jgi:hypothetical protein
MGYLLLLTAPAPACHLPESVIPSLPQIVRNPAAIGPPFKILIKNDRNFFISGEKPIGILVV